MFLGANVSSSSAFVREAQKDDVLLIQKASSSFAFVREAQKDDVLMNRKFLRRLPLREELRKTIVSSS